jgi:hypothetical protein
VFWRKREIGSKGVSQTGNDITIRYNDCCFLLVSNVYSGSSPAVECVPFTFNGGKSEIGCYSERRRLELMSPTPDGFYDPVPPFPDTGLYVFRAICNDRGIIVCTKMVETRTGS